MRSLSMARAHPTPFTPDEGKAGQTRGGPEWSRPPPFPRGGPENDIGAREAGSRVRRHISGDKESPFMCRRMGL